MIQVHVRCLGSYETFQMSGGYFQAMCYGVHSGPLFKGGLAGYSYIQTVIHCVLEVLNTDRFIYVKTAEICVLESVIVVVLCRPNIRQLYLNILSINGFDDTQMYLYEYLLTL